VPKVFMKKVVYARHAAVSTATFEEAAVLRAPAYVAETLLGRPAWTVRMTISARNVISSVGLTPVESALARRLALALVPSDIRAIIVSFVPLDTQPFLTASPALVTAMEFTELACPLR
jgi:hypothetical protein